MNFFQFNQCNIFLFICCDLNYFIYTFVHEILKSHFKFSWTNLIYYHEIPMRKFSHQPKMNMWVFHATFKKQIIFA